MLATEEHANLEFLAENGLATKEFNVMTLQMDSNVDLVLQDLWEMDSGVTDDEGVTAILVIQVCNALIQKNPLTIVAEIVSLVSLEMELIATIWMNVTWLSPVILGFGVSIWPLVFDVTPAPLDLLVAQDFKDKDWNLLAGTDRDAMTSTNATMDVMEAVWKIPGVLTPTGHSTVESAIKDLPEINLSVVIIDQGFVPTAPSAMTTQNVFVLLGLIITFASVKLDGLEMENRADRTETWTAGLITI
jgi:hypothetical protein